MKLIELFKEIGIATEKEETYYDRTKYTTVGTGKIVTRTPTCHSKDRTMIKNHMNDELPFYVKLGPIAVFAVRIPTSDRYSYFIADSIGFKNYEVSRYSISSYGQEEFNKIKDKLMAPATFGSFETDEFKIFTTLKTIGGD